MNLHSHLVFRRFHPQHPSMMEAQAYTLELVQQENGGYGQTMVLQIQMMEQLLMKPQQQQREVVNEQFKIQLALLPQLPHQAEEIQILVYLTLDNV